MSSYKFWLLSFLMLFGMSSLSYAKQIALSFDDGLDPIQNPDAAEINQQILQTLKRHDIHAIVYPALNKIGAQNGLKLIKDWGQQGHTIGNHSARHLNLNKDEVSIDAYLKSVSQGHEVFSTLHGFVPRYRFPYLKEGNTLEKRDAVRVWLKQHGYQSGAVSVDASDWYYNQLFLYYQSHNDHRSLDHLKSAYIAHLLNRAEYYDQLAQHTIKRSPKHVMLLHVRAINAAWLQDVIQAFQKNGWQFISAEDAYQDPMYQIQLNTLPAGESILWSIAKVYGIPDLRYPAEDAVYEQQILKQYGLDSSVIP